MSYFHYLLDKNAFFLQTVSHKRSYNSFSFSLCSQVERSTAPKPQEEFTGMMGNLARALDERHKVMHSSGKQLTLCNYFSNVYYKDSENIMQFGREGGREGGCL